MLTDRTPFDDIMINYVASGGELTTRQIGVMCACRRAARPLAAAEVAILLDVSAPTISRAVATLVELNYVSQERDSVDHRKHMVSLTDNGKAFMERMQLSLEQQLPDN